MRMAAVSVSLEAQCPSRRVPSVGTQLVALQTDRIGGAVVSVSGPAR